MNMLTANLTETTHLSGADKAAILIMYLNEEVVREIFSRLSETEIRRVGEAISRLAHVEPDLLQAITAEFAGGLSKSLYLQSQGNTYLESVFPVVLGQEKGRRMLRSIEPVSRVGFQRKFEGMQPGDDLIARINGPFVLLRQVTHAGLLAPLDGALVGLQLAHNHAHKGCLADAVATDDADALAAVDVSTEILEERRPVKPFAKTLQVDDMFAALLGNLKANIGACNVGALDLRGAEFLHLLLARLHLTGPRSRAKTLNEAIEFADFSAFLFKLSHHLTADLRLDADHVVIVAGVGDDRLVIDVCDVGTNAVEKSPVVADNDKRTAVATEEALQPTDGRQIQMVGGFIEDDRLWIPEEGLGQQDTDFHATAQGAKQLAMQLLPDAQSL